jgi:4-amino-4-deoxy-L-arabinose transferase-like glycosyltransferase
MNAERKWLLAILLLAFALRMVRLGDLRMWGDEGFSVYSGQRGLYAITFEGKDVDPHPPLYYYLLHFYLPLAGFSELAVRYFSVLFGMATVALMFTVGKKMYDARVGVVAAAFTAIAPFAVHYSQEVRMYALVIFLSALTVYLFVQLFERDASTFHASRFTQNAKRNTQYAIRNTHYISRFLLGSRVLWLAFALVMLLIQYTQYQAAFLFVAQGLFLLPFLKKRFAFAARWSAVACVVVVLFLPWLFLHSASAFSDVKDVAGDTVPMDAATFLARGFAALTMGPTLPPANALPFAALFLALVVVGLLIALATRAAKANDWLLVLLVAVPMLSLYPLYVAAPLYRGRLFALALVPLVLLIARSVMLIAQRARWLGIPIGAAIVVGSVVGLNHYYFRYSRYSAVVEDYLPAIRAIEERAQPGDVVLFHAYWHEGYFWSHYRGAPIEYRALEKQEDLEYAVAKPRNVWAIVQALPHHDAETWLAQHAFPLGEEKFGQMRVLSYRAGPPARGERFSTPVAFNNGIALLGYHMNDAPLESGRGIATVQLDWQAARKIADDFVVGVRLTNPRGDVIWAQADSQPASDTLPTSQWQADQVIQDNHVLAIPAGTPPGEYAVQIVLYDSKSGIAANIVAPENLRAQSLMLGTVVVRRGERLLAPTIPNAFDAQWNEIALVGFSRGADEIAPGDALPLTLYWQAREKPARDYLAAIQVVDSSGAVRADARYRPASATFPTRAWDAGETWLDKIMLPVDAEAASGDAFVRIGLVDEATGEALAPRGVELMRVKITGRARRFDVPSPQNSLHATLGGKIKLLGYDLDADAYRPGATIGLTLYWQSLDKVDERYTVFVHVFNAAGALIAQRDGEPGAGATPTTSWLRGEVIADRRDIALPKNLAPGEYAIVVGMYQTASGKRLIASETNADHALLTKIRIVAR